MGTWGIEPKRRPLLGVGPGGQRCPHSFLTTTAALCLLTQGGPLIPDQMPLPLGSPSCSHLSPPSSDASRAPQEQGAVSRAPSPAAGAGRAPSGIFCIEEAMSVFVRFPSIIRLLPTGSSGPRLTAPSQCLVPRGCSGGRCPMDHWVERRTGEPECSTEGGPRGGCRRTGWLVWADPPSWPSLVGPGPWHSAVNTAKSTRVC